MLTAEQYDALTELINIGFSRAANSLSELTGDRILLQVPKVDIVPVSSLKGKLSEFFPGDISTVHQVFKGEITGDAVLVLNSQDGLMLCSLVQQYELNHFKDFDNESVEILTETGNIIMNSCLGVFGNLLNVHFSFSIPIMTVSSLDAMLKTLKVGETSNEFALLILMGFVLRNTHISGYIVMLMNINSIELLVASLNKIENNIN